MSSRTRFTRGHRWVLVAGLIACCTASKAQEVAPVRAGTWELNGAVGYTYGIDEFAGNRSRVNGGATLSYALTKHLLPYVEYSYFPGVRREQRGPIQNTTFVSRYEIRFTDFHGGMHFRFTPAESRFVPYAAVGVGVLHAHAGEYTYQEQGLPERTRDAPADTGLAVNFGGGLRYYVGQYWGVRGELKAYKPTGTFDQLFSKLQFGVFWQFGNK